MFKSGSKSDLYGFASDHSGAKLPEKFKPWSNVGVIRPDKDPPYRLDRAAIEAGIREFGYQLLRKKPVEKTD